LDDRGEPRNVLLQAVGLCNNANVLALSSDPEVPLAFVTCASDAEVTVVDLHSFAVVETIAAGDGANEMVVDPHHEQLYVANAREHTISVIGLDPVDRRYLRVWAQIEN
jgi:hypothetical protein